MEHVLQDDALALVALENHVAAEDVGGALAYWPGDLLGLNEIEVTLPLAFFLALTAFHVNQAGRKGEIFPWLFGGFGFGTSWLCAEALPRHFHGAPRVIVAAVADGHRVQFVAVTRPFLRAFARWHVMEHVLQDDALALVALENHVAAEDVGGALAYWPGDLLGLNEIEVTLPLAFFLALTAFHVNQAGRKGEIFPWLFGGFGFGTSWLCAEALPRHFHGAPRVIVAAVADGHRVQFLAVTRPFLRAFASWHVMEHVLQDDALALVALENHVAAEDVGGAL